MPGKGPHINLARDSGTSSAVRRFVVDLVVSKERDCGTWVHCQAIKLILYPGYSGALVRRSGYPLPTCHWSGCQVQAVLSAQVLVGSYRFVGLARPAKNAGALLLRAHESGAPNARTCLGRVSVDSPKSLWQCEGPQNGPSHTKRRQSVQITLSPAHRSKDVESKIKTSCDGLIWSSQMTTVPTSMRHERPRSDVFPYSGRWLDPEEMLIKICHYSRRLLSAVREARPLAETINK